MTWLHTNAPADRDGSAATPAARIAATARLAGRVANRAAGPSARTGRSTGCSPALSGIRASCRFTATRSTRTAAVPPASPTAIAT